MSLLDLSSVEGHSQVKQSDQNINVSLIRDDAYSSPNPGVVMPWKNRINRYSPITHNGTPASMNSLVGGCSSIVEDEALSGGGKLSSLSDFAPCPMKRSEPDTPIGFMTTPDGLTSSHHNHLQQLFLSLEKQRALLQCDNYRIKLLRTDTVYKSRCNRDRIPGFWERLRRGHPSRNHLQQPKRATFTTTCTLRKSAVVESSALV